MEKASVFNSLNLTLINYFIKIKNLSLSIDIPRVVKVLRLKKTEHH